MRSAYAVWRGRSAYDDEWRCAECWSSVVIVIVLVLAPAAVTEIRLVIAVFG